MLFAFIVLHLVSSVLRQEIGCEERLQNDPFYVKWDVKSYIIQSISQVEERMGYSDWFADSRTVLDHIKYT